MLKDTNIITDVFRRLRESINMVILNKYMQQRPDFPKLDVAMAKNISITETAQYFINAQIRSVSAKEVISIDNADLNSEQSSTTTEEYWIEFGRVSLI